MEGLGDVFLDGKNQILHVAKNKYLYMSQRYCARHGTLALPGTRGKWGQLGGRGMREGPTPQKAGKISCQRSARKEATWSRKKKEGQVGCDKEGPA
jgi:hypothetical protein